MLSIALVLVVTGLAIAFGLNVMGDIKTDIGTSDCTREGGYFNEATGVCQESVDNATKIADSSTSFTATGKAIEGVAKLPDKFPLIATVVVAAIIIGILVRYLFVRLR